MVYQLLEQLHYLNEISTAISHQDWRTLLTIEDPTYTELVWDFYTTFHYHPKAAMDSLAVTLRLGGRQRQLIIDGLAYAMGIQYHPFSHHEVEIPNPSDWKMAKCNHLLKRSIAGLGFNVNPSPRCDDYSVSSYYLAVKL
ncbi:unnamed protein product [Linum trigynum]|uniref:Uncharacterized protein n=1 Tax=Linum trigynum TaxID=586398 RepID=A0AAV2CZD4_9ROSI